MRPALGIVLSFVLVAACAATPEPVHDTVVPAPPPSVAHTSSPAATPKPPSPWPGNAIREMQHEPCDVTGPGSEGIDMNGDGRPDVVKVMSGGLLLCKASDLSFDGNFDVFAYFDAAGEPVRIERDLDFDQKPDQILFKNSGSDPFCTEVVDRDADGSVDSFTHVPDCADRLK